MTRGSWQPWEERPELLAIDGDEFSLDQRTERAEEDEEEEREETSREWDLFLSQGNRRHR